MTSFLRRLALKAIIAAKKPSIMAAQAHHKHSVGCQDGARTIKSIQHFAETYQSRVSLLTSRQPSRTCPNATRCTASGNMIQTWPRSSPDGTQAPQHTACITTVLTHTSRPAVESIKDALTVWIRGSGHYVAVHPLRMLDSGAKRICAPNRHSPITLHYLQKRRRCRPTTLRTRQMRGRHHDHTKVCIEQSIPGLSRFTQPGAQAEGAWMLSLTYEAAGTTLTRRLLRRSPPMLDSYPPAVAAQATWPSVMRRTSSTVTLASTWPIHP